jgi:hypothetical protein
MLSSSTASAERPHWQNVSKLILEEVDVVAVSCRLRLVLLKDAKLRMSAAAQHIQPKEIGPKPLAPKSFINLQQTPPRIGSRSPVLEPVGGSAA